MRTGSETGDDGERTTASLDVAPTPVRGSGGGRGRGAIALAVVGLALAGAVGAALLQTAPRRAADVGVQTRAPGSPVAAAASPATAASGATAGSGAGASRGPEPAAEILDATPIRLRPTDLGAAVRNGSLDGRLVFVDGTLQVNRLGCRSLATVGRGCVEVTIPGLGVPVTGADPSLPMTSVPPSGAWIVTVVRGGSLVYLGSLVPDDRGPASLPELQQRMNASDGAPQPGTLFEARGVLVARVPPGCGGVCPPVPRLVADPPASASTDPTVSGTVVDLRTATPEVDPSADFVAGTFLVDRTDAGTRWRLVARYVPSRAVRVLVP